MTTLQDIKNELPNDEYCYFVEYNGKTFYEIIGRKFELNVSVEYVLPIVKKIYNNYGARAILAKENNGIDFKAVSHALRAAYQLRDIYKDGDFEYPLKENDFIFDVKMGRLDYISEVAPEIERIVDEVNLLAVSADLPDEVDVAFWDDFVYNVYSTMAKG